MPSEESQKYEQCSFLCKKWRAKRSILPDSYVKAATKLKTKSTYQSGSLSRLGRLFLKFLLLGICVALIPSVLGVFSWVSLVAAGYEVLPQSSFPFFHINNSQSKSNIDILTAARALKAAGALGDYFGGMLNPVVALCALVGLMWSVAVQRDTLRLTRTGLRDQLDQENFFQLLANREIAVQNLELASDFHQGQTVRGRMAIRVLLSYIDEAIIKRPLHKVICVEILERYEVVFGDAPILFQKSAALQQRLALFILLYSSLIDSANTEWTDKTKALSEKERQEFRKIYPVTSVEDLLGHIFRSTYQTLKFIYQSELSDSKKRDLQNYLRAQMSEAEFTVFALTALTSIGKKSRAAAIAFDFYQNRLLSEGWARPLAIFFDPNLQANYTFACKLGYKPLPVSASSKKAIAQKLTKIQSTPNSQNAIDRR